MRNVTIYKLTVDVEIEVPGHSNLPANEAFNKAAYYPSRSNGRINLLNVKQSSVQQTSIGPKVQHGLRCYNKVKKYLSISSTSKESGIFVSPNWLYAWPHDFSTGIGSKDPRIKQFWGYVNSYQQYPTIYPMIINYSVDKLTKKVTFELTQKALDFLTLFGKPPPQNTIIQCSEYDSKAFIGECEVIKKYLQSEFIVPL